jgi:Tfp pilus assembly protein PilE
MFIGWQRVTQISKNFHLMVKNSSLFISALFIFSTFQLAVSQTTDTGNSLRSGTIDSQFEYIYESSNNFDEYKVVKKTNLDQLKSNILDSMKTMRSEVADQKSLMQSKNDSIESLNSLLALSESEKQTAIDAKDNFTFLGIGVQKAFYSSLMWVLVAVLATALAFFSFQYLKSFNRIKKAQRDLEEFQDEFENHRKNTLDRERKMKRELIDAQMKK